MNYREKLEGLLTRKNWKELRRNCKEHGKVLMEETRNIEREGARKKLSNNWERTEEEPVEGTGI